MSNQHSGNMIPEITYEEHDGTLNAKKTSLVSAATIYAVVNTSAAGVGNSIVTVANTPLSVTFGGNVTLDGGSLTGIVGNVTLSDPKTFIGLVSLGGGFSNLRGNITIDSGTLTAVTDITNPIALKGNVTLDAGSLVGIRGNLTLSDSKGFIGLVTTISGRPYLSGTATAGNASIGTTPIQVLAGDTNSTGVVIQNISNTTVFVSHATLSCNASLSLFLTNLDQLENDRYTGTWFASVGAGSAEVRFLRIL